MIANNSSRILFLTSIPADRVAPSGYVYPACVGSECTDPDGKGLPWGMGSLESAQPDSLWLVMSVASENVNGLQLDGWHCKFKTGRLEFEGDLRAASDFARKGFVDCVKQLDDSRLAASGYDSNLAASGDCSRLAASGHDSVACIAANGGRVKVGHRGAFALTYWDNETGWEILVGKEGRDGIKADTYYTVRYGKIVEQTEP